MYLPENNEQMFDILTDLRLYAAMNALPGLAEQLDDALMLLAVEANDGGKRRGVAKSDSLVRT